MKKNFFVRTNEKLMDLWIKDDDGLLKKICILLFIFLIDMIIAALFIAAIMIFCTWVDMTLWNWFVVGYFHIPKISFGYSYGLGLVTSLLTRNLVDTNMKDPESSEWIKYWGASLVHGIALCLGAFAAHFLI